MLVKSCVCITNFRRDKIGAYIKKKRVIVLMKTRLFQPWEMDLKILSEFRALSPQTIEELEHESELYLPRLLKNLNTSQWPKCFCCLDMRKPSGSGWI